MGAGSGELLCVVMVGNGIEAASSCLRGQLRVRVLCHNTGGASAGVFRGGQLRAADCEWNLSKVISGALLAVP